MPNKVCIIKCSYGSHINKMLLLRQATYYFMLQQVASNPSLNCLIEYALRFKAQYRKILHHRYIIIKVIWTY